MMQVLENNGELAVIRAAYTPISPGQLLVRFYEVGLLLQLHREHYRNLDTPEKFLEAFPVGRALKDDHRIYEDSYTA